jgi:hypothetical protein
MSFARPAIWISLGVLGCVAGPELPNSPAPATNIAEPKPPVPRAVGRWTPRNDQARDVCAWRGGEFSIDDFESIPLSDVDMMCASYSVCSWYVDVDGPQPRLGLERPRRPWPLPFEVPIDSATGSNGRGMAHAVDDGWLVAFNHGEWGSVVWWYSADGSARRQLGLDALVDFFVIGDEIWAPAAKNFRAAEGYMLRFERGPDGWRALAGPELLQAVPEVATLDGDTLLIASNKGVEEVDAFGRVSVLAEVDFWDDGRQPRYPSSIARTRDGTILIGHALGITRLSPERDGYSEDFLVPPPCRETVLDLEGPTLCNCVGLIEGSG